MPRADLVLEGGGVKGLGTVGAVLALMDAGYSFPRLAGTSVGALAAAFVAAGVDAAGLEAVLGRFDLPRIPDRRLPVPVLGESWSLLTRRGAFEGDYVQEWVERELARLGVRTFGDLRRDDPGDDANLLPEQQYRLVVTVTDVTHGRLLRLPWDYHLFNRPPDEQSVAEAVRMSLSIPLYFRPCTLRDPLRGVAATIVDGGVLSNFPIEIFDRTDGQPARWPTFGVRLMPDLPAGLGQLFPALSLPTPPPVRLVYEVIATALVGRDQTHLDRPGVRERTMTVDTSGTGIVEFRLGEAERRALLARGRREGRRFLAEHVGPDDRPA